MKLRIGFVGLGVMGRSMVSNLLAAGHSVGVYTRTRASADGVVAAGAEWREDAGTAARGVDCVITMVGYPRDVEDVYFGAGGILESADRGAILVDTTTSSPRLARRIAQAASERGLSAIDAPVSGGDIGAREARLTIMCGGDPAVFDRVRPILESLGTNVRLLGPAGAGQHTKMVNQVIIAAGMVGICEGLTYAGAAGLDPGQVLESISTGAAASWSLSNLAPRMLADNFAPGFFVKHFIKDLSIALESAGELGLDLPGVDLAHRLYTSLAEAGFADRGTQALLLHYRNRTAG